MQKQVKLAHLDLVWSLLAPLRSEKPLKMRRFANKMASTVGQNWLKVVFFEEKKSLAI